MDSSEKDDVAGIEHLSGRGPARGCNAASSLVGAADYWRSALRSHLERWNVLRHEPLKAQPFGYQALEVVLFAALASLQVAKEAERSGAAHVGNQALQRREDSALHARCDMQRKVFLIVDGEAFVRKDLQSVQISVGRCRDSSRRPYFCRHINETLQSVIVNIIGDLDDERLSDPIREVITAQCHIASSESAALLMLLI